MKPVMQTKFGKSDGNCLQACVCSILELPIEDAPDLPVVGDWFKQLNAWSLKRGWMVALILSKEWAQEYLEYIPKIKGYSILGGTTNCGSLHAVVAKDGQIVHDPHPNTNGMKNIDRVYLLVQVIPSDKGTKK